MRILHINPSLDPADGGPPAFTRHLVNALGALGHSAECVTLDRPDAVWNFDFPCAVHAVGPGRLGKYRWNRQFVCWLENHQHRFDIFVVHGIFQYHAFAARKVLSRRGRPYVVFIHGALDPWFKSRYPLKHLKKWIYWPWGDYRVLRNASAVMFTAEDERLLARQSFWLYSARELVVNYGIESPPEDRHGRQAQAFRKAVPQVLDRKFLLFLSRIDEKKGCRILIEAFAEIAGEHPELVLVMAGPDRRGLRPGLENLARRLGITDRVIWAGPLSGDAKWGAFRSAEVFVLTSHTENFGIVVAESLGCGTPVLISRRVNIWREVESGGGGMVAEDTVEDSVRMLRRYLTMSAPAREAMGRAAWSTFQRHFDAGAAAKDIASRLEEISAVRDPAP